MQDFECKYPDAKDNFLTKFDTTIQAVMAMGRASGNEYIRTQAYGGEAEGGYAKYLVTK